MEGLPDDDLDEYGPEEKNTMKVQHKITPQTQGRTASLLSKSNACLVFRIAIKFFYRSCF